MIDLDSASGSNPGYFTQIAEVCYFTAESSDYGRELWATDGTEAGTHLVKDINTGTDSSNPSELTEFNGKLYFVADDGENGVELWVSDGTESGTVMVKDIYAGEALSSSPSGLVVVNGALYFSAEDADHGVELWTSDGTEAGTVLVKDIYTGTVTDGVAPNSSNPLGLTDVNGTLFFVADDGEHGYELWTSDGTEDGTVLVADINPDGSAFDGDGVSLLAVDGTLFFVATDGEHGYELWTSDGTESGTTMVQDIYSGSDSAFSVGDVQLIEMDGILYFAADNGENGDELWRSDGTSSGTYLLKDINEGSEGDLSEYTGFTVVGDVLYFSADDGTHGKELWKTDGTASGTVLVDDINADGADSYPYYMVAVDGLLYFSAYSADSGRELWKSDGTAAGTVLVDDTATGTDSAGPSDLTVVNEHLVFSATIDSGYELCSLALNEVVIESARLSIWIDGEEVEIDDEIGVYSDSVTATIYTPADGEEGQLLFESDTGTTIGAFFDIWRTAAGNAGDNAEATFDGHTLMGYAADSSYAVQMFVNGEVCTDFEDYVIQNGDEIILVYTDNPVVSIQTNYGSIVIELFEEETPITVENFLDYVNDGDYINSIFHRSDPDFVIQGGGYTTDSSTFSDVSQFTEITDHGEIENESLLSNAYGTVAMARTSDYDSATSQFYVNLTDNSFLDPSSSTARDGYTVFGRVLDMTTVETIAALPVDSTNASPFGELPYSSSNELVVVESVEGMGEITGYAFYDADGDGIFDTDEVGMEGATVFIDANGNGEFDDGETWATTDSDGMYLLLAEPGDYAVCAIVSSDNASTTGSVTASVEMGVATSDVNLGELSLSAPVGTADTYTMDEDDSLTVGEEDGVLANDTDPDGDDMTVTLADGPEHGTVSLSSNGSFTYEPYDDFAGTDTFTYTISDGTHTSGATTVTINVANLSDAPVAEDDAFDAISNGAAYALDVLDNDSDPDASDTLTIVSVTQGSNGGIVSLTNEGILYAPEEGFSGTETFSYTIQDGDGTEATATVTVTVAEGSSGSGTETGTGSLSGYVYIDADGDSVLDSSELGLPGVLVTLTGTSNAGTSISKARLTDSTGYYSFDDLPAGTYVLTESQPEIMLDGDNSTSIVDAIFSDDTLSEILLSDGDSFEDNNFGEGQIRSGYVTVRMFFASTSLQEYLRTLMAYGEECAGNADLADAIREGTTEYGEDSEPGEVVDDNTAPVSTDDEYTIDEDTTLSVDADGGLLANDTDADADTLTVALVSGPANGKLSFGSDGAFTYVPDANFAGTDTFTYVAYDGTAISDPVTVTIAVENVNDTPVATEDDYSVDENTTLAIDAADGVLKNDSDIDGDSLSAVLVSGPAYGDLDLTSTGSFEYKPNVNFAGTDSFTYYATDGSLVTGTVTVTITVEEGEDVPITTEDAYTIDEDTLLSVDAEAGVLANDTDDDGDTLRAVVYAAPEHGDLTLNDNGSFDYTPAENYYGTDTFTYYATDELFESSLTTVTIEVKPVNDAPVGETDAYTTTPNTQLDVAAEDGVLNNDDDVEGDPLTASLVTTVEHGTLSLENDGSFTYIPALDYHGIDTFTYKINDGSLDSQEITVNIHVNTPADAEDDSYEVDEDGVLEIDAAGGLLANDDDLDEDTLTVVVVTGPEHGTLEYAEDGSFEYTPAVDFYGTDTFTYTAKDGYLNPSEATVTITVRPMNDAPEGEADAYSVDEDNKLTVDADEGVLDNDGDVDGDALKAILSTGPEHGTLTLENDGSFTYEPYADFNGVDTFTYYVSDDQLTSADITVTITVQAVNDAPIADADEYTIDEDNKLIVDASEGVLDNDEDTEGDSLTAVLANGPEHGTLKLEDDGSFTYEPYEDFNGSDSFTYYAADAELNSAETTVTITVGAVNDLPVATTDAVTLETVTATDIDVLANDTDADTGDTITIEAFDSTSQQGATITLNADNTLHYDPTTSTSLSDGTATTDSFSYTITDGNSGVSVTGTVTVTISLDSAGTTYIVLNGDSISVSGGGATVDGTTVTITAARTYSISGTLNDGQIIVDTDDDEEVTLILNGADITCSDSAPIYIVNASDAVIVLADDTENYVTDGDTYTFEAGMDEPDAAIFSNDDLVIEGNGSLTVDANYKNGISTSDDLDINGGTITVTAVNHGIRGKDSVVILDGSITVTAGGDGIQSDNDQDATKGYVTIEGGTLDITATSDGIQAETTLTISGGDVAVSAGSKGLKAGVGVAIESATVDSVVVDVDSTDDAIHTDGTVTIDGGTITLATGDDAIRADVSVTITGGDVVITESAEGIESATITIDDGTICIVSSGNGISGSSEDGSSAVVTINGGTLTITAGTDGIQSEAQALISGGTISITSGGGSSASLSSDTSAKAIKADGDITVTGGTITINSADDAIHSDDTVTISGGDITISSGDDGIHAESSITINGGEIDITKSYEGIESTVVTINGGTIHLVSSDDGINIAGGIDGSGNEFSANPNAWFELTNGYVFINAQGDGCDSNGSVYMSGGTLIINGPTGNMNGALDYNGTFEITGGYLLAVGSAGMAESTSASSTQETLAFSYGSTQSAGVMIHIETESGQEILTFVPVKTYQSVVLSSPDLVVGTTYYVYSGGSCSGTEIDGLYSGGTYTAGTELGSIKLS